MLAFCSLLARLKETGMDSARLLGVCSITNNKGDTVLACLVNDGPVLWPMATTSQQRRTPRAASACLAALEATLGPVQFATLAAVRNWQGMAVSDHLPGGEHDAHQKLQSILEARTSNGARADATTCGGSSSSSGRGVVAATATTATATTAPATTATATTATAAVGTGRIAIQIGARVEVVHFKATQHQHLNGNFGTVTGSGPGPERADGNMWTVTLQNNTQVPSSLVHVVPCQ